MNKFRVIVAGGRDFFDYELLRNRLDFLLSEKRIQYDVVILSGCAKGADALGMRYAEANEFDIETYPADWDNFGRSAGPKRNTVMAEKCDCAVIFWNVKSRGSLDMIKKMNLVEKPYRIVRY